MDDKNFIRISDRTWITKTTTDHNGLSGLRSTIKNQYKEAIIYIIEDHKYVNYQQSLKQALQQVSNNGLQSLNENSQINYYFIQLTFLNDIDNSDFIMNVRPDNQLNDIVSRVNSIYFDQY
jgi:hypothetical protein